MNVDRGHASRWLCLRQIGGMTKFEVRRYWRRRGLPMVMLLWLTGILLSGWALGINAGPASMGSPVAESAVARRMIWTNGLLMGTAVLSAFFAFFVVAVIVADTVSYDRQLGVMEWLNALHLNAGTYLAGKLCGMWAAVLVVLAMVMLVGGVGFGLLYGVFDTAVYLQLWSGTAAIALIVSGISMLVAAGFSSRRVAMFLGLVTAVCCFFVLISGYIDFFQNINNAYARQKMPEMIADFCRIDPASCTETPTSTEEAMFDLPVDLPTFTDTLLRGGIALIIAWLGAWGWQKWQQNDRQIVFGKNNQPEKKSV